MGVLNFAMTKHWAMKICVLSFFAYDHDVIFMFNHKHKFSHICTPCCFRVKVFGDGW